MRKIVMSRLEILKKTKSMFGIFVFQSVLILFCLFKIVVKTNWRQEILFVLAAFFLLRHYRRMLSYIMDIVKMRTHVIEGTIRKLVYGVDYDGKTRPIDYDLYELILKSGEALRFPCEHCIFNTDVIKEVRLTFLESTHDLVKAEVLS